MKRYTNYCVVGLVAIEVMALSMLCLYGRHGWYALKAVEQQKAMVLAHIVRAEQKIAFIQNKIASWHSHSFFAEQIAREQLHLARPDEVIIYYTPEQQCSIV